MEIKTELNDDWLLAKEKHIQCAGQETYLNTIQNEGLSNDFVNGSPRVKQEFDEVVGEDWTNINHEGEDIILGNCEYDTYLPRVDKIEGAHCSNAECIHDQLITIEDEFSVKNEFIASILSDIESSSTNNDKQLNSDNDITKRKLIPLIVLEKTIFNERNFVCSICFYTFESSRSLRMHKKSHKNSNIDQSMTNMNISRGKSSKLKFNSSKIRYKCDRCGFETQFLSQLKLHEMTHLKEKIFTCKKCNFKSAYMRTLKRHTILHSVKKPFKCDVCNYETANRYHFKIHTKMAHTDEKPLKCGKCDFKCVRRFQLTRHEKTHRSDKPFKCDVCNFACRDLSNLSSHKKIHENKKPFECTECDFKSLYLTSVKYHKMTHSRQKPQNCEWCDFKCTRLSKLNKHKKEHTQG